ncbi:MAG: universal stress protein [Candidatus Aegiribacteria sp.]
MSEEQRERGSTENSSRSYDHVLISVSNPNTADQLVLLGRRLTDASSVLHIMNVTTEAPFPQRAASWRKSSQLVMDMTHFATRMSRVAKPLAATARSIPDAVVKAAKDTGVGLIIMGWFGRVTPLAVKKSRVVNKVLHRAPCDIAILKSRNDIQDIQRIILPVGQNVHDNRLAVVRTLRQEEPTEVVLVHVLPSGSGLEEEEAREAVEEQARQLEGPVEVRLVHSGDVVSGILSVADENDLVVVGPGREWVFNRFLFGHHADRISNRAPCSVLLYKSSEKKLVSWFRGLFKTLFHRSS